MMMSENPKQQDSDPRPRVTGYFVEDPEGIPLSVAIGRAVVGAGSLEAALRLEAARLLHAQLAASGVDVDSTLPNELSKLEKLTSGGLLEKLRKLGLPRELDNRIADAVDRRNVSYTVRSRTRSWRERSAARETSMLWSNASSDSPWTAVN
jgi:hypothetical protein